MLVWEDDIRTPSTPVHRSAPEASFEATRAARPVTPSPLQTPASPTQAAPVAAASAVHAARRIDAVDKQIINGLTDLNQRLSCPDENMAGAADPYPCVLRRESVRRKFGIALSDQIGPENRHLWAPKFKAGTRAVFLKAMDPWMCKTINLKKEGSFLKPASPITHRVAH